MARRKKQEQGLTINVGDTVRISGIKTPHPGWCQGIVKSVNNWARSGEGDNWYIELEKTKATPLWDLGYGYWKQKEDGGIVEIIKGPSYEQYAALVWYAEENGRDWRRKLCDDWMRAGSNWRGPYHLLHQIRNALGSSWLYNDFAL
jgi:hypothetical protein